VDNAIKPSTLSGVFDLLAILFIIGGLLVGVLVLREGVGRALLIVAGGAANGLIFLTISALIKNTHETAERLRQVVRLLDRRSE